MTINSLWHTILGIERFFPELLAEDDIRVGGLGSKYFRRALGRGLQPLKDFRLFPKGITAMCVQLGEQLQYIRGFATSRIDILAKNCG